MFVTNGTFLLIGAAIEPQIRHLTHDQRTRLDQGLAIVSKYQRDDAHGQQMRTEMYRKTFGVQADYAIPAWVDKAMEAIATQYEGPHKESVRGLAACIATRTIIQRDAGCDAFDFEQVDGVWTWKPRERKGNGKDDPKGGRKAKLSPDKPAPKHPGGAAAKLIYGDATPVGVRS